MPKFELTNDITSLKGYLQALRLGGVFSHSGLTGISRQQPIVADVNHKTLIKIDEKVTPPCALYICLIASVLNYL